MYYGDHFVVYTKLNIRCKLEINIMFIPILPQFKRNFKNSKKKKREDFLKKMF